MKRPEQHETDSQGDAIFRAAFADWAVNPSEHDYGWDYIVEVFRNGASTGVLFAAQLKSSRETAYSSDGSFISQPLSRDAAEYLALQLRQPTFLFHADVHTKRLYWSAIQLDQRLMAALERGDRRNLTVRVPTVNVLPDNINGFSRDLADSHKVIVRRALLGATAVDFADAMRGQPAEAVTQFAVNLHRKGFCLELQAAHEQMRRGDLAGAIAAVRKVLSNSSDDIEVQFNATLELGELEAIELSRSDKPQNMVPERKLITARELCRIAKRTPRHLHWFARLMRRSAELGVTVHKIAGISMSWYAHSQRGDDPLWVAVLSVQLGESLLTAHRKHRDAVRLANAIARSPFRWVTARPVVDIAVQITTLAGLLDSTGFAEPAGDYRASALQLFKFGTAIATENQNMDELYNALANARMLESKKDGEIFQWIRSISNQWPETSEYRQAMEDLLSRWSARQEGVVFEGDVSVHPRQIHYNILASHGIDPTKEPWTTYIDRAIKDEDPTRVLKTCQHKEIYRHPIRNRMLDRLALEHANPKILKCEHYNYSLEGLDLDGIDERFRKQHCNTCLVRVPRPADWAYYDTPSSEDRGGQ